MTEWDKLCEEFEGIPVSNGITLGAKWKQVRAVGNEMQKENTQLKKDVKELANMGSDDLHKRLECEKLMQLANGRCNELAKQLGETQQKNEKLIKYIIVGKKLLDQTNTGKMIAEELDSKQRLEAIRGIIEYEDVTECIEKIQHVLDGGVRKEMQEKEQ